MFDASLKVVLILFSTKNVAVNVVMMNLSAVLLSDSLKSLDNSKVVAVRDRREKQLFQAIIR
jgi:hypothetical protein